MTERSEQLISLFLQVPFAMSDQQRQELSAWITQDTENARDFIRASLLNRCIHDVLLDSDPERKQILQSDETNIASVDSGSFDRRLWEMLLKEEQTAPDIEIQHHAPEPEKQPARVVKREHLKHRPSKAAFLSVITAAAAMAFMLIYIRLVPHTPKVEVATLENTVNAQWAESAAPAGPNTRLMTNHEPLMLRKGYAELIFDNHAKVVLEAPAEFQVLSYDQIKLSYGRLYATVPKEAVGFIVSTPTTKIIDLGTEFGVQTDFNGNTELHVVKGKTSLVSGLNNNKISILLNAGSAKKMTANASAPIDIPFDQKIFARQIDSKNQYVWRGQNISLADIVGGGDGFGTGQLDKGINPVTGGVTQTLVSNSVYPGPSDYVLASSNPYIDGIFVPGVNEDRTRISSTGTQTDEFPKTSGKIWGYIFDGAWHQSDDTLRHHLQLDGISLGDAKNPALTMHSNLGITFDLSAIQQKLPGLRIKSFSSAFGISQTVKDTIHTRDFSDLADMPGVEKLTADRFSMAEFWVFLDGKKVLRQTVSSESKAASIDIPIDEGVRFLTLAITEADDTFMFDWGVFARPELVLELADEQVDI